MKLRGAMTTKTFDGFDLVGTYRLKDIAAARADRDRLRFNCHNAFLSITGGDVFLFVKRNPNPESEI